MYYFLSPLWAGHWTRWPAKVPAKTILRFCHPCHIPLVLMLPSCGNALHKAASFNLHKVVSEHLLCACLFLARGALYSGCKPELKSPPSSCFLYAYLSKAFFLPPFSCFLKHLAQTSEHLAIISVNPPLSHNTLHFPSDFYKFLLLLPPCLSSDGPSFLPSVWTGICFSSPRHDNDPHPMFPSSPLPWFCSSLSSSLPAVLCCVPSHLWVEVVLQEGRTDIGKGCDLILNLSCPHMSTKMQVLECSVRAGTKICLPSWPGYPEHKTCLLRSSPGFSVHSFNWGEWLALEVPFESFRSCPSYLTSPSH